MENKDLKLTSMHKVKHIHFIGIGGAGMCGIAEVLANEGYMISGSDQKSSLVTKRLEDLGIEVFYTHQESNIDKAQVVVMSSAIKEDNAELIAAKKKRIPIVRRAEMLAELMRYRYGIAVAGTHGKTTTTSLIASIFAEANLDPTFIIGGLLNSTKSNARLGSSRYLIAEADESDASFLHLQPMLSVVTNIEADHLDTYGGDFQKLLTTFVEFLHNLPFYGVAVVCLDDEGVKQILPRIGRRVISYGLSDEADFKIEDFKAHNAQSSFSIVDNEGHKESFCLNLAGLHMVKNATAAIAIAREEGISYEHIKKALEKFLGVGRRFESYGCLKIEDKSVILVDDYGHHPSELQATIEASRLAFKDRRLMMIFQPHRYTRTRDLYEDFVKVLSLVDELIILEVYSAGENAIVGADSKHLCHSIRAKGKLEPHYAKNQEEALELVKALALDQDVILTQGAGNVVNIAKELAKIYAAH